MRTCSCGAVSPDDHIFCTKCGKPIEEGTDRVTPPRRCCVCNAELEPDASFCTGCGTPASQQADPYAPSDVPLDVAGNGWATPQAEPPATPATPVDPIASADSAAPAGEAAAGKPKPRIPAAILIAMIAAVAVVAVVAVYVFTSSQDTTSGSSTSVQTSGSSTSSGSSGDSSSSKGNGSSGSGSSSSSSGSDSSSGSGSGSSSGTTKEVSVKTKSGATLKGTVHLKSGGYVIPDSSTHEYTKSELKALGLNAAELCIARNEIFAREGYDFNNSGLQAYFDSCSWYTNSGEKPSLQGGSAADKNSQTLLEIAKESSSTDSWLELSAN